MNRTQIDTAVESLFSDEETLASSVEIIANLYNMNLLGTESEDLTSWGDILVISAEHGLIKYVKQALFHKLSLNMDLTSALTQAASYGHLEIIKLLVEHIYRPDLLEPAIERAVRSGHLSVSNFLTRKQIEMEKEKEHV